MRALASCDRCGDVDIEDPSTIVMRRCEDTGRIEYRFRCPACSMIIVRPLFWGSVRELHHAGAAFEVWRLPLELAERPGASVPPICADDLIDFHGALEQLPTATARERLRG